MQNSSASSTNSALRTPYATQKPAQRYTTLQTMRVFNATWYSNLGREEGFSVRGDLEELEEEGKSVSLSRLSVSL